MDKLVNEMIEQIAVARVKASKIKISTKNLGDEVFIYPKNGETFFNPKYISMANYFELIQLEECLKKHQNLTEEELEKILSSSKEFEFLLMLKNQIPNFLHEIRRNGAKAVAIIYLSDKLYGNHVGL